MPGTVTEERIGQTLYCEFKEITVPSDALTKNHMIKALLEEGWVLLDVQVQRKYKCHDDLFTPEASYSYLLGKPSAC